MSSFVMAGVINGFNDCERLPSLTTRSANFPPHCGQNQSDDRAFVKADREGRRELQLEEKP